MVGSCIWQMTKMVTLSPFAGIELDGQAPMVKGENAGVGDEPAAGVDMWAALALDRE